MTKNDASDTAEPRLCRTDIVIPISGRPVEYALTALCRVHRAVLQQVDMAKNLDELIAKTSDVGIQYDMIMINHDLAKQNNYQIMFEIRKSLFMLPVVSYGRNIPKDEMDNRTATGIDDFLVAPFPDNEVR
eukprot:1186706-Prorocentrum_minimum.AAC.2